VKAEAKASAEAKAKEEEEAAAKYIIGDTAGAFSFWGATKKSSRATEAAKKEAASAKEEEEASAAKAVKSAWGTPKFTKRKWERADEEDLDLKRQVMLRRFESLNGRTPSPYAPSIPTSHDFSDAQFEIVHHGNRTSTSEDAIASAGSPSIWRIPSLVHDVEKPGASDKSYGFPQWESQSDSDPEIPDAEQIDTGKSIFGPRAVSASAGLQGNMMESSMASPSPPTLPPKKKVPLYKLKTTRAVDEDPSPTGSSSEFLEFPHRPIYSKPPGVDHQLGRHDSHSSYDSRESPRRERREGRDDHTFRKTVLSGIGLGWLTKKYKDRKDRQEQQRFDDLRAQEIEDERRLEAERRSGTIPPRYTGDGTPRRSHGRVTEVTDSDISSDLTASTVEPRRSGPMPPLAAGAIPAAAAVAAGAAGAAGAQARSRHDITEPVPLPPREPREWHESGSEVYNSAGGREHRRHHPNRGREAEAAVAGAALGVAAAEEERRRRERSRGQQSVASPPVSVKVKVMPDRGVTLRRLTEEEAAAARRDRSRSSLSATDTAASNRRYRRDESARRDTAEAGSSSRPLSPPRPAFAAGRTPKDSSYFSGPPPPESRESPEIRGTRSGMSPSGSGAAGGEDPAERRRRRRLERSQRQATGTVDYDLSY
jgi:hypothetical protein